MKKVFILNDNSLTGHQHSKVVYWIG